MVYENSTQLGAGFFLVFGVWSLVGLAVYIWYLWSLSRLFPYLGLPSGWGWIPIWNQWQLIQRGGLPGWLALFMIVPGLSIVALVVSIIAIHRINTEFGKGAGFTVLGAFIPPLWATLFGGQLRDREFDARGYADGGFAQDGGAYTQGGGAYVQHGGAYAQSGGGPDAAAGPAYDAHGFAPQPGGMAQGDQAWQGLPPVPQQHAAAQDPWAAAQGGPGGPGAPIQPGAPVDPWQQQPAPTPHGGPAASWQQDAPAQAPVANNWGFSNTTEGDFERLAAEGVAPRPPAPLGGVAPPRPFSWPAVEDTNVDRNVEHESGPLMLPEPSAAALSNAPADAPQVAPAEPAHLAGPAEAPGHGEPPVLAPTPAAPSPAAPSPAPPSPAAPEPSIFDRDTPANVGTPETRVESPAGAPAPTRVPEPVPPIAIPNLPEPVLGAQSVDAVAPPAAPVAAAPVAPPPGAAGGLDEDHTVVVSRRTRWGLELPGGETLELEGDDIVIGRKPEARETSSVLQVSDPTRTTSKSHARLRRAGEDWSIEDLHSTNGVSLVGPDGAVTQLEPGRGAPATEQMIIGTLEVRLRQL